MLSSLHQITPDGASEMASPSDLKRCTQDVVEAFAAMMLAIGESAARDMPGFDQAGWNASVKLYRDDFLNPQNSDFITRLDEAEEADVIDPAVYWKGAYERMAARNADLARRVAELEAAKAEEAERYGRAAA